MTTEKIIDMSNLPYTKELILAAGKIRFDGEFSERDFEDEFMVANICNLIKAHSVGCEHYIFTQGDGNDMSLKLFRLLKANGIDTYQKDEEEFRLKIENTDRQMRIGQIHLTLSNMPVYFVPKQFQNKGVSPE